MTDTSRHAEAQSSKASIKVHRILQGWLIAAVPLLLVIASVRLVMSPLFLQIEYARPGFPADSYGFTTEDRLLYAPYTLNYLINGEGIDYLAELRLPGNKCFPPTSASLDCAMYNDLELRHMADVKTVTRMTFFIGFWGGVITLIVSLGLWRSDDGRFYLQRGILQGSLLTMTLVAMIVVAAITAWEFFFDLFHEVLFEQGTWRFYFSDTLIRLFPEQFWFDAAITAGVLTTVVAVVLFAACWQWGQKLTPP